MLSILWCSLRGRYGPINREKKNGAGIIAWYMGKPLMPRKVALFRVQSKVSWLAGVRLCPPSHSASRGTVAGDKPHGIHKTLHSCGTAEDLHFLPLKTGCVYMPLILQNLFALYKYFLQNICDQALLILHPAWKAMPAASRLRGPGGRNPCAPEGGSCIIYLNMHSSL